MTDKTDSKEREALVREICRAVAELPDRNSPEDWPEAMLVTHEELADIVRASLAASAGSEPVAVDRAALIDAIAQGLHGTWHCTRVWEAWHVGTMSQDDFEPVDESDTPAELADAVLALLPTHPSPPEGAGWINSQDMTALRRADECFEDGEGHDLRKDRLDRLLELGVIRHNGAGYYSITSFGKFVLGCAHSQRPLETSLECNARLAREHRARLTPPASEAKGA